MPPHSGPPRKNNNKNDIKSLRQLYRSSLPSLTELFPNWSQDDLLFVMDECQGELDLAIIRISEGHANQWGQVKSKKPKVKKPFKDSSALGKGKNTQKENKPRKAHQKQEKPRDIQPPQPSWASILRGPAKPEDTAENNTEKSVIEPTGETTQEPTTLQTEDHVPEESVPESVQQEEAVLVVEKVTESVKVVEQVQPENPVREEEEPVAEPVHVPESVLVAEPVKVVEPLKKMEQIHTVRKPTVRRLNQVEAVVLPSNQMIPISSVNVQFGSLNLSNGEEKPIEPPVIEVEVVKSPIIEVVKTPVVAEKIKTPVVQKQEPINQTPVIEQSQPAGLVAHKAPIQPQEYMNYNHVVPEYNMYSTMEQRMSYYDPSVYGQSPSMTSNHLFPREKYIAQQQQQQQQEAGYYPYYYQQQYQPPPPPPPPQASVLGYPYVNKPMYPVYKPTTANEYPPFENDMIQQQPNNMMPFDKQQQQQQQQYHLQQKQMDMYYQQPPPQPQQQPQQPQQYPSYYYPQQSRPYWHQA
ncbi:hypothetical protein INT48_006992 [Thamnidium elegans]|uniref:RNA polymerase II degradation factor 1 n=1 Tax=Thamnidium elegans TaxID=101142 RepID=A0A8H7SYJ9_9FUNG|nr:hypothetical protein INT48_006992 [Thamnidium elegans]